MRKIISLSIVLFLSICSISFAGMSGSIGPKEYRFKKNLGTSANKVGTQRRYSGCTFLAQYDDNLTADGSIGSETATFAADRTNAGTISPGTYFDSSGVMQIMAATDDLPRFNHGYYDTSGWHAFTDGAGVMIESASTNYLKNSYCSLDGDSNGIVDGAALSGTGTITGTPTYSDVITDGGLTATGLINISGAGYQRIQYTGVAGDGAGDKKLRFLVAAEAGGGSQNDVITFSIIAKGTLSGCNFRLLIYENESGVGVGTLHTAAEKTLLSTDAKFDFTTTFLDAATDSFFCYIELYNIGTGDTVDIYYTGTQGEVSPFATSFIPTTTAALTRNKETLKYVTSGNRTAATESCVVKLAPEYADTIVPSSTYIFDTDTKRRAGLFASTSDDVHIYPNSTDSGTSVVNTLINDSWTANTEMTLGYAMQHSSPYIACYYQGVADGTNETADDFTDPVWGTYWWLGSQNNTTSQLNGTIFGIAFFDRVKAATDFADLHNPDINWKRCGFFN